VDEAEPALVDVRIVGLPIEEQRLAAEHFDELLREFTLLQLAGSGQGVPVRLVELREELGSRFQSFTARASEALTAAAERGEASVDLTYRVPAALGPAARQLSDLLDEADEFCRAGVHLLTLATPARSVRYRQWFLGEFTNQLSGGAPTPWTAFGG
jgi:hypothetical protein